MVAYKAKVVPGRMDGSEVEVWVPEVSARQQKGNPKSCSLDHHNQSKCSCHGCPLHGNNQHGGNHATAIESVAESEREANTEYWTVPESVPV